MQQKTQNLIRYFNTHGGIVRFSSILKAGFHPDDLMTLIKEDKAEKIARGLYRLTHYTFGSHPDFVITSLQAPKGIICLVSALAFHEATSEIPHVVDIAIPVGARANKIKYPPIRFYHFAAKAWGSGIEDHRIEGHKVRIYGLAKTIADCFKFRNKIGIDIARDALKVALSEKGIKPKEIMQYAKICRVDRIVKPILEAIL
ncbi:MAG: type IV toxin-antitoxin system AbiEi family antitoxin domain-containing protein [Candidatus Omnitrophica bacterium]|nr:type IV toxin-antitoxin system AbiEi family antitoxin domain-containing protein [Candidatus Omnitrophota bacterium]MBU1809381.1 type IV toxin-antitoxin system AbiEi family antitoxin domain-containing protein [Candidatus Omnitrophota bacterium]